MDTNELLEEIKRLKENENHYKTMMDESSDPTFSFYPDGTYRYVNKAFAVGTGHKQSDIIGRTIWDIFDKEEAEKRFAVVQYVFSKGETREIEVRVPLPSGDTYYLTTAKPVFKSDGTVETVVCSSKNITKRKLAEIALKKEHERLLKAMEEIKQLSGLLPICSSCKKIRDDQGYWNQIEAYFSKHSDLLFSHGLCPECMDDMYGKEGWFKKRK